MIISGHQNLVFNLFKLIRTDTTVDLSQKAMKQLFNLFSLSKSTPLNEPISSSHSLLNTDWSGTDSLQRNYDSTDDGNTMKPLKVHQSLNCMLPQNLKQVLLGEAVPKQHSSPLLQQVVNSSLSFNFRYCISSSLDID